MKQYTLKIARRDGIGRQASRRVRQDGRIPAVLYGKLNPPQALSLDLPEFSRLMKAIGGSAAIIEIKETDSDNRLSFIQEIQRDPISDRVLHVDLHEVSADEEMEVDVKVHSTGDCVGVRTENGLLEVVAHEVRVRCLPKDLPEFIEVDVTNLHVNESIHVRDLPVLRGLKYLDDPGQNIFSCLEPAAEVEVAPVAAAPVAGEAAPAAAAAAATAAATPAAPAAKAAPAAAKAAPAAKAPPAKK
ncbi:MAG TPA: 50S ribosomal protein L25 [Opitutaceae bacterium]